VIARCPCGKLSTWHYMPDGATNRCDDCVPRGCSCNKIHLSSDDPAEHTDAAGRLLPCCEWDEEPWGVDDMRDWSDYPTWERIVEETYPDLFEVTPMTPDLDRLVALLGKLDLLAAGRPALDPDMEEEHDCLLCHCEVLWEDWDPDDCLMCDQCARELVFEIIPLAGAIRSAVRSLPGGDK
jgi:hypothetical protein